MKLIAISILLTTSCVVGYCAATVKPDDGHQEKKVEIKKIPIFSIYATSSQEQLKRVEENSEGFKKEIAALIRIRIPEHDIFLARGDDIKSAVLATLAVLTGKVSADEPASADAKSKSDKYWLVASLGVGGSSPPMWEILSAHIQANSVQLKVSGPPRTSSDDFYPFFVWVPLGTLSPEAYLLEVLHEKQGVTVKRSVTIKENRCQFIFS